MKKITVDFSTVQGTHDKKETMEALMPFYYSRNANKHTSTLVLYAATVAPAPHIITCREPWGALFAEPVRKIGRDELGRLAAVALDRPAARHDHAAARALWGPHIT